MQSLRFAFRALLKNQLLSSLAIISLALAIAGNATVFSLVSAMLLWPLPYPNPETLLLVWQTDRDNAAFDLTPASPANYADWKRETRSFERMAWSHSRTHEIGVRMAMGAWRVDVLQLILKEGVLLAVVGFIIGIPGVLMVARSVQSIFTGFASVSAGNAIVVGLILFATAVLASYLPARRAASVPPVSALRHE